MRRLAAALLAGLLLVAPAGANPPIHLTSIVALQIVGRGSCSGTHLGAGRILTAAHCLVPGKPNEAQRIQVRSPGVQYSVAARVVSAWPKLDIAILQTDDEFDASASPLFCESTEVGQLIFVSGFPMFGIRGVDGNPVTVQGIVSSQQVHMQHWPESVLMDAHISGGHSGSGVFDSDGRLVGVAVGGIGEEATDNDGDGVFVDRIWVFVPSTTVCRVLRAM